MIVAEGRDLCLFLCPICMGKTDAYPLFFTSIVVSFTQFVTLGCGGISFVLVFLNHEILILVPQLNRTRNLVLGSVLFLIPKIRLNFDLVLMKWNQNQWFLPAKASIHPTVLSIAFCFENLLSQIAA
jgi:hypothetical protein